MTRGSLPYEPTVDEYVIAVYDNRLGSKVDFFIDGSNFIFNTAPINGRIASIYSIEAPIPSLVAVLLDIPVSMMLVRLQSLCKCKW